MRDFFLEKERRGRSVTTIVALVMKNFCFRADSHKDMAWVANFDIRLHLGFGHENKVVPKVLWTAWAKWIRVDKAASWYLRNTENAKRTSDKQILYQYDHTKRRTKSRKEDAALRILGCTGILSNQFKSNSFSATELLNLQETGLSQLGKELSHH